MTAGERPRRVLVCEDSSAYATALTRALEHGHEIEVVGVCATAEAAIEAVPRLDPDLVTMDLGLPGLSGLDAVEQIMGVRPVPILVISSAFSSRQSPTVAEALAAGALDAIPKDDLDLRDPGGVAGAALRSRVKLLSGARVIRHPRARLPRRSALRGDGRRGRVVGVCASTGGPAALAVVLGRLPRDYQLPVLVVQHMSGGFVAGFARWLEDELALPVRLPRGGERLERGVWVAPDGAHLVVDRGRLALDADRAGGGHRPSGDVLLASVARWAGADAVGVVLTGMGRDGAAGLAEVKAAGGLTIAQDEATSAVYGMPRAAAPSADLVLPLEEIGKQLASLRLAEAPLR